MAAPGRHPLLPTKTTRQRKCSRVWRRITALTASTSGTDNGSITTLSSMKPVKEASLSLFGLSNRPAVRCSVPGMAVLACIVILSVIGLGFYALHKIKPGWFRIQAGAGQRFTFSIEMGQGGDLPGDRPTREEHRELEAGRDKPRELEAGPSSSEPPAAADQNDAAA
jgi:hypothetical protein